jgi:hypothetical protein
MAWRTDRKEIRMSKFIALIVVALILGVAGCSSKTSQPVSSAPTATDAGSESALSANSQVSSADANAIRAAIEDRLRGNRGLNMSAMEMTFDSIDINGDQAQAHASFHVKNGGATGMTMQYFLQRSGNGWVVTNAQPADGNTQLPPPGAAHPGVNSTQSAPSMPDVDSFLKNHPSQKSN